MKRKLTKAMLLITLFISVEIIFVTECKAEKVFYLTNREHIFQVDKNGEDKFTTIQEAIDNATDGTTIFVKNGVYTELLNIKKKIKIIGEDKDKTIINPISGNNGYAIRLGAPEITIEKLSVTNGAPGLYTTGIQIAASKTEIRDCNIYDVPVGIAVWTSNNTIENCNFTGCNDEGIALIGTKYSNCDNNKITYCTFYDNCDGIELQYSSENNIEYCEFYENTHTGIDAIASSNNGNTIFNCKIYNNSVHGIYLSRSSDNQISNCQISDNVDGDIIMCKNSFDNEIENPSSNTNQETYTTGENSYQKNMLNRILRLIPNLNNLRIIRFLRNFYNF